MGFVFFLGWVGLVSFWVELRENLVTFWKVGRLTFSLLIRFLALLRQVENEPEVIYEESSS